MKYGHANAAWRQMMMERDRRRERDEHQREVTLINIIQRENPGMTRNDAARSASMTLRGCDPHAAQGEARKAELPVRAAKPQ